MGRILTLAYVRSPADREVRRTFLRYVWKTKIPFPQLRRNGILFIAVPDIV